MCDFAHGQPDLCTARNVGQADVPPQRNHAPMGSDGYAVRDQVSIGADGYASNGCESMGATGYALSLPLTTGYFAESGIGKPFVNRMASILIGHKYLVACGPSGTLGLVILLGNS